MKAMTVTILKQNTEMKTAVLPIDQLKPHEKGSPLYLELIKQEILTDGILRYPIIADEKTGVILDGMHRWLALKSLGLQFIPVILVDTSQGAKIRIGKRRIHRYMDPVDSPTVEEVIEAGLSGRLMEPRSTRHFFSFSKFQRIDYPIRLLGKGMPRDVSKYLAKASKEENQAAIREWLGEMSEELEFLTKRKEEVENERREFLNRIKNVDTTSSLF